MTVDGEGHAAWLRDIAAGNYVIVPVTIAAMYPDPQQFLSRPFLNATDAQFPDAPQAGSLMRQGDATTDSALRLQDYQQAEQLLVHNVVTCPLYQSQLAYRVRQCVHGFSLDPLGQVPLDAWADVYIDSTCPNIL